MINSQAYVKLPREDKEFLCSYANELSIFADYDFSMRITPAIFPFIGDDALDKLMRYAHWAQITLRDRRYINIMHMLGYYGEHDATRESLLKAEQER